MPLSMCGSRVHWRKSSYSTNGGDCVECASLAGSVAVRDSKHPGAGRLTVARSEWRAFLAAAKRAEF